MMLRWPDDGAPSDGAHQERSVIRSMAGLEKEAKKVVKQATGSSSKKSEGKKSSGGKKKGKGSGADKAKRAARELLK
jgi:hypothetical protein